MKKSTIAILFTVLITFSCIFYSCNLKKSPPNESHTTEDSENLSSMIQALEDQIIELQQNHYISEAERENEIKKLEALIVELKQNHYQNEETETSKETETNKIEDTLMPSVFHYTVKDGDAMITGYNGNEKAVAIPSYIDGNKVTSIADDAFDSDVIETVIIPNTVEKIGWFAFAQCSALKSVTVSESVSSIGYSAFPIRSDSFYLICPENSFTANYAKSYGIRYTPA